MECNNDFRHVCYKDLKNYIERDKYFSDFTKEEIELIQKNLGIVNNQDSSYNPTVIIGTYDEIYNQASISNLKIGYKYVIKDFRSIYLDEDGNICGTDNFMPSKEYTMFLTPSSTSTFDKRVQIVNGDLSTANPINWIVEYDIRKKTFSNGTTNKGTITYLKDTNNNSAYYDFKNIKFKKRLEDLNKGATTYNEDTYLYTFDNGGNDASNSICKNNHLEYGAYRNVFLGNTQNVTLSADCHDNIFFKNCENCNFDYGTYNNYFKDNVIRCSGSVHEKELDSITSNNYPKRFDILEDREVMVYLDPHTQTYQLAQL